MTKKTKKTAPFPPPPQAFPLLWRRLWLASPLSRSSSPGYKPRDDTGMRRGRKYVARIARRPVPREIRAIPSRLHIPCQLSRSPSQTLLLSLTGAHPLRWTLGTRGLYRPRDRAPLSLLLRRRNRTRSPEKHFSDYLR